MGCCCGPMQCGTGGRFIQGCGGCGDAGCGDCDGTAHQGRPYSPLDGLRKFRNSLTCGSGCGETYYGEWSHTPPTADPCCADQCDSGPRPFAPFCWQPGRFFASLYGVRNCDGTVTDGSCGCEGECDGSCGGSIGNTYPGYSMSGSGTNCGCASCQAKSPVPAPHVSRRVPATDNLTRNR